jgi:hypothetical protein
LSFLHQADHQGFLNSDHLDGVAILKSVEEIIDALKTTFVGTNSR